MQGSIYIYAMDGTPLVTGKSAQAMVINSKIGIVTGLTLDPIKKVTKFDLNIVPSSDPYLLSWCSGPTKRAQHCGSALTPLMIVGSLPLPNGLQVNPFYSQCSEVLCRRVSSTTINSSLPL